MNVYILILDNSPINMEVIYIHNIIDWKLNNTDLIKSLNLELDENTNR